MATLVNAASLQASDFARARQADLDEAKRLQQLGQVAPFIIRAREANAAFATKQQQRQQELQPSYSSSRSVMWTALVYMLAGLAFGIAAIVLFTQRWSCVEDKPGRSPAFSFNVFLLVNGIVDLAGVVIIALWFMAEQDMALLFGLLFKASWLGVGAACFQNSMTNSSCTKTAPYDFGISLLVIESVMIYPLLVYKVWCLLTKRDAGTVRL